MNVNEKNTLWNLFHGMTQHRLQKTSRSEDLLVAPATRTHLVIIIIPLFIVQVISPLCVIQFERFFQGWCIMLISPGVSLTFSKFTSVRGFWGNLYFLNGILSQKILENSNRYKTETYGRDRTSNVDVLIDLHFSSFWLPVANGSEF